MILLAQVRHFQKTADFSQKSQALQPAWLRESGEAVGAHRAFIWGKGARQPHINGSGQRPTFNPVQSEVLSLVVGLLSWVSFRAVLAAPVLIGSIRLNPVETFLPTPLRTRQKQPSPKSAFLIALQRRICVALLCQIWIKLNSEGL